MEGFKSPLHDEHVQERNRYLKGKEVEMAEATLQRQELDAQIRQREVTAWDTLGAEDLRRGIISGIQKKDANGIVRALVGYVIKGKELFDRQNWKGPIGTGDMHRQTRDIIFGGDGSIGISSALKNAIPDVEAKQRIISEIETEFERFANELIRNQLSEVQKQAHNDGRSRAEGYIRTISQSKEPTALDNLEKEVSRAEALQSWMGIHEHHSRKLGEAFYGGSYGEFTRNLQAAFAGSGPT